MAFTYSADPANSRLDAARLAIGDTVADTAVFQDEEINYLINDAASWNHALAKLFRYAATTYASRAMKRKLGPQTEDTIERAKMFAALADKYEKLLVYTGTPPLPSYEAEKVFSKNMMANGTTATEAE